MNKESFLKESIQDNLEFARLLSAQVEPNRKEINDALWQVLGLSLELDNFYAEQIKVAEAKTASGIKEELLNRQEVLDLNTARANAVTGVFNPENEDEKNMIELFDSVKKDMDNSIVNYDEIKSQYELVLQTREKADELELEKQEIANKLDSFGRRTLSFDEMNASLTADYERFITSNAVDTINVEQVKEELNKKLIKQARISRKKDLLETAVNLSRNDYSFDKQLADIEIQVAEDTDKLFAVELAETMKQPVNSFNELHEKAVKIYGMVSEHEMTMPSRENNTLSYRAIAFDIDVKNIEIQMQAPMVIAELDSQMAAVEATINEINDNVSNAVGFENVLELVKRPKNQKTKEELRVDLIDVLKQRERQIETPIISEEPVAISTPVSDAELVDSLIREIRNDMPKIEQSAADATVEPDFFPEVEIFEPGFVPFEPNFTMPSSSRNNEVIEATYTVLPEPDTLPKDEIDKILSDVDLGKQEGSEPVNGAFPVFPDSKNYQPLTPEEIEEILSGNKTVKEEPKEEAKTVNVAFPVSSDSRNYQPLTPEEIEEILSGNKAEKDEQKEEPKAAILSGALPGRPYVLSDAYKVKKVEPAKKTLLDKVKNFFKKKIVKVLALIATGVLIIAIVNAAIHKDAKVMPVPEVSVPTATQMTDTTGGAAVEGTTNESVVEIAKNILAQDAATTDHKISIGDEISVNEGSALFSSSDKAHEDENGKNVAAEQLKKAKYVNRMALLSKEHTNTVIGVTTTKGQTAEELANEIGVDIKDCGVALHVSSGDANGNFIETSRNEASADDIAWVMEDDVKVVKAVEKELVKEKIK